MKNAKTIFLTGLASIALLGGGLGITQALADESSPSPTDPIVSGPGHQDPGKPGHRRGKHGGIPGIPGASLSGLAARLDVDESSLVDAFKAARTVVGKPDRPDPDAAEVDRRAAREEHERKMIAELSSQLGKDEATIKTAIDETRAAVAAQQAEDAKPMLDQAVTDGKLTQEEASAVEKAIRAGIVHPGGHGR